MEATKALGRWLDWVSQMVPGGKASLSLALVFLAVFLGVLAVSSLFAAVAPIRRAARDEIRDPETAPGTGPASLRTHAAAKTPWDRFLEPLERSLVEHLTGRARGSDLVAATAEQGSQRFANIFLIVGHQDGLGIGRCHRTGESWPILADARVRCQASDSRAGG